MMCAGATDVVSYFSFIPMNGSADEFLMTLFFVTLKVGMTVNNGAALGEARRRWK